MELTAERLAAFEAILAPLASFRRAFGRDVKPDFIAELYAAKQFDLTLPDRSNEQGADATDRDGRRYQVKFRSPDTLNVDFNNFDFDFAVLVNLDDDYRLAGIWRLGRETARGISAHREKYRKFQVTQARFKAEARRGLGATNPEAGPQSERPGR
jgi:hypothetical protein